MECSICNESLLDEQAGNRPNPPQAAVGANPDPAQNSILCCPPCGHLFHRVCLQEWLDTGNNTCPLCRHACAQETLQAVFPSTVANPAPAAPAADNNANQIFALNRQNQELQQGLDGVVAENENLRGDVNILRQEIQQAHQQLQVAGRESQNLRDEINQLKRKAVETDRANERWEKRFRDFERQVQVIEAVVARENDNLQNQVNEIEERVEELEEQLDERENRANVGNWRNANIFDD